MKRVILLTLVSLFTFSSSLSWAITPSQKSGYSKNPITHQVNLRLKSQMMKIHAGLKNHSLSPDQAKSLWMDLKSVRKQEVEFFKQNGNHSLTTDQQNQLNALLDKNSSVLGETKTN